MKKYNKIVSLLLVLLVALALVGCKKDFTVKFDANNNTPIVTQEVKPGGILEVPTDPVKEGYDFDGWYLGDERYNFNLPVESDLTLIAKWDLKELTVIFDTIGGSQIENATVQYGGKVTKPADPTKPNNIFIGWYLNDAEYDFNAPVYENITLVAHYEAQVTVSYNFNYDNLVTVVAATPGDLLEGVEVADRVGFEFAGWFLNRSYTRPWNMATDLMPEENLTLYARWIPIPVITGIADFTYYIGDVEPDLMEGVVANDVLDGNLIVNLNIGNLDFSEPGVYEVEYSATNLSDKETVEVIVVTVVYENRLIIEKGETLPQKLLLQVEEEILGFYIELSYEGELQESNITLVVAGWICDIYVNDGLITIAATGLTSLDVYLPLEILTVNKNVELTVVSVIVDKVAEEGFVVK